MINGVSQSRTRANAAFLALAQLAAVGCGSTFDASAHRAPAAGDSAGLLQALEQSQNTAFTSDPIAAVGHGVIIAADGRIVEPTAEFVREAQQYYIDRLLGEASPAVLEEFEQVRTQLEPAVDAPRELAERAQLIDWLIERVHPNDAVELTSRNKFIEKAVASPDLALVVADPDSRMRYLEDCQAAGVPLPPDWDPDPTTSKWKKSGTLSPDFIGKGTTGTVWYHVSSEPDAPGLCIALPRALEDGTIDLLGVICQGNATSKACFWDSQEDFGPDQTVTITSGFRAGPELNEAGDVCTSCHRGENVFIVHPDSALDIDALLLGPEFNLETSLLRAKAWVTPLVHPDWPQNGAPGSELEGVAVPDSELSCLDCHTATGEGGRLGLLDNPGYCSIMWWALRSDKKTMPSKARHLERLTPPQTHLEVIGNACRELTPELPWD